MAYDSLPGTGDRAAFGTSETLEALVRTFLKSSKQGVEWRGVEGFTRRSAHCPGAFAIVCPTRLEFSGVVLVDSVEAFGIGKHLRKSVLVAFAISS